MEDALELAEKAQGVLDVDRGGERGIDVLGELVLNTADVDVELDEVTIKGIVLVVKERVLDLLPE